MPELVVAFDADDTLWHNELYYRAAEAHFAELLAPHLGAPPPDVPQRLYEREVHNLPLFGFGAKSFAISMMEVGLALAGDPPPPGLVSAIIELGRGILAHPVELLEGAAETLACLQDRFRLLLVTKGDTHHQLSKLERSGLRGFFQAVEVVPDKRPRTYRRLLEAHGVAPEDFVMVGNSPRSDILPVLALGAAAIHVPFHTTWIHEALPPGDDRLAAALRADRIGEVPPLIEALAARRQGGERCPVG